MPRLHPHIFLLAFVCACNKNPVNFTAGPDLPGSLNGTIADKYLYPIWPISNARVRIISASVLDSATTDSSGKFQFLQLPDGNYTLTVTAAAYDTVSTTILIEKTDPLTVSIELSPVYRYEAGTVLAGFKDSITVDSVFHLFSSLGLTIRRLNGFDHQSNLPADSLPMVREVLKSKPYLNETDYTVFAYNGVIKIVGGFNNLDSTKVADWCDTGTRLKISSVPSPYRDGEIHTQDGQEIVWVRSLRGYPMIRWLELNYYIPIWGSHTRAGQ